MHFFGPDWPIGFGLSEPIIEIVDDRARRCQMSAIIKLTSAFRAGAGDVGTVGSQQEHVREREINIAKKVGK